MTHPAQTWPFNEMQLFSNATSGQFSIHIPNNSVCADYKLWPGVPLVVGDVVMGLEPDPLLAFGEKSVVAGLSFAILHHCGEAGKQAERMFELKMEP